MSDQTRDQAECDRILREAGINVPDPASYEAEDETTVVFVEGRDESTAD